MGIFLVERPSFGKLFLKTERPNWEVFGFAPYWKLSNLNNVDWDTLSTFAYFSLPINSDGSIDRTSYEWQVFEGEQLSRLYVKARDHNVRRVVTLTQMDAATIEKFLEDASSWETLAKESATILVARDLDGVNIDFEYIPSNDYLRVRFSQFIEAYSRVLRENSKDPYITVSVLASSVRFNKIYDIARIANSADAVFMMAYDFYYSGSDKAGPSAPLYGYNAGRGPFWYDVSTAVDDFLQVVPGDKIIMGVPYYGWNYPTNEPGPEAQRGWGRAFATTSEKAQNNKLLLTTPTSGWDSQAQVAWRGYWDSGGWHVVYMEDEKSLEAKFEYIRGKNLKGVGIWALGFDADSDSFWEILAEKFRV